MSARLWLWTQRCRLTGETLDVHLSDADRRAIENQPNFRGWQRDELVLVDEEGSEPEDLS